MGGKWRNKLSQTDQVYGLLLGGILGARFVSGGKLPPLRKLALRLGVGVFPVRRALIMLEAEGYVVRRHGSGTYVRDRCDHLDALHGAILCMPASGHVYAEMAALFHRRLHDLGILATVLDTEHGNITGLLQRALRSPARFLLLKGGGEFPGHVLENANLQNKCIIAVIAWDAPIRHNQVHRLLVDHAEGSRRLADYLWSNGHRRILIVAPPSMLWAAGQWEGRGVCPPEQNVLGAGLARLWSRRGGRVDQLPCHFEREKGPAFNENHLLDILNASDFPTAVVGLRDVDAWCVRETLRRLWPEMLQWVTFVGNGDTPWSRTAQPPFTTLNWNLERIADLACDIIREVQGGKTFPTAVLRLIPPLLVAR